MKNNLSKSPQGKVPGKSSGNWASISVSDKCVAVFPIQIELTRENTAIRANFTTQSSWRLGCCSLSQIKEAKLRDECLKLLQSIFHINNGTN